MNALPVSGRSESAETKAQIGFVSTASVMWGAEQSLLTLARALKDLGVPCVLIAYCAALVTIWQDEGLGPVVFLPDRPRQRARRNLDVLRAWLLAPRAENWVYFNFELLPLAGVMRLLRPRMHVHLDLHDYLPGSRGRLLLRHLSRICSSVVCVSHFIAEQLQRGTRRAIMYRPISGIVPRSATGNARTSQVTVGVVGRLDPQKQHALAVDAVASLDRSVQLILRGAVAYGSESYFDDLVRRGRALLGSRFAIMEPTAPEDALDGIDILLVCNPSEPLGRTVAEAQLAGIPVVVPATGGAAELVTDGISGLTYAPGDPEDLSRAISKLICDPALALQLAQNARAVALARHDPRSYAMRYIEFLESVAP